MKISFNAEGLFYRNVYERAFSLTHISAQTQSVLISHFDNKKLRVTLEVLDK